MMERGLKAQFINGLRVTDAETVSIVNEVLNRDINPHIASTINELGGKAQSVQGADVFQATKAPAVRVGEQDVDLGFVGEVTSCAVKDVQSMIAQEIVPVISPIGKDAQGQLYNINADTAAAELAIALDAYRILYLSDVNGILLDPKDPSSTVSSISPKDVLELRDRGVIDGGMIPKVESCLKALQASVEKVHLIDGRIRHSLLLELFTDHGIGTEIVRG
jgi:acetylglutamate kinase